MNPMSARPIAKHTLTACLLALPLATAHAQDIQLEESAISELHCVVMPSAVVDVASGVNGRVESISVERGDHVEAGQLVAALESDVEKANLVLAKARADLEADIHLRKARLGFEERSRDRTEKLHTNRVVSAHERDEAKTNAILAGWQLRQAVDNQYLASLELVRAEAVLKRRLVHSPIEGVVVERFKWPGEYVEEEPIVRVARLDPLWVEVVVPVSLNGKIRKNMLAEVMTETEDGKRRDARVTVIDPMGDAASGTFRVRLELPNPELSLFGGVKCKAHFPEPARYAPEPEKETVADEHPAAVDSAPKPEAPHGQKSVSTVAKPEPVEVQPLVGTEQASSGFIVLTPHLASRGERRALAAELRKAGVNDFLFMGGGPYAGRISLGVYDRRHMAEKRVSELSRLGFDTDAVPRESQRQHVQVYTYPIASRDTAG